VRNQLSTCFAVLLLSLLVACSIATGSNESKQPTSEAQSASIPERFHGLWLANVEQCGQPDWQEGYLISTNQIWMAPKQFYNIAKIESRSTTGIVVTVNDRDAGWGLDGKFGFELSKNDTSLRNWMDGRTASFDYIKCEK
jgi:hypothetical protein